MAKQFEHIEPAHATFIAGQKICFTALVAATGRVNVCPRGTETFRILDAGTAAYGGKKYVYGIGGLETGAAANPPLADQPA